MHIFATFSTDGLPTGFYPDDIFPLQEDGSCNEHIPTDAINISESVYSILINEVSKAFVNGEIVDYTPPPAPRFVPDTISKRQLIQQCIIDGTVTFVEAIAFARDGTLPSVFENAFAQIPNDQHQQDTARFVFLSVTTIQRHNATTQLLQSLLGKSDAQMDALFIAASQLV